MVGNIEKTWTAWGCVVAMALPNGRVDLGNNVRIDPLDEHTREFVKPRPRMNHPQNVGADYFSAIPGESIVRSDRIIWLKTKASSKEEAWDQIEHVQLPIVVAALANFGDPAPRVELLRIAELDDNGRLGEHFSPWMTATFAKYDGRVLTVIETRDLVARHYAASRYAAGPSRRYLEAVRQQDTSDLSSRSLANVVLSYFLVVEEIARTEKVEATLEGAAGEKATRHIDNLRKTLGQHAMPATHLKKIRATVRELENLEQRSLNPRIEKVAIRLDLTQDVLDDALAIAKLRNTTLAHPGREAPDTMNSWVIRAERVARVFLAAYVQSFVH